MSLAIAKAESFYNKNKGLVDELIFDGENLQYLFLNECLGFLFVLQ